MLHIVVVESKDLRAGIIGSVLEVLVRNLARLVSMFFKSSGGPSRRSLNDYAYVIMAEEHQVFIFME